MEKAIKTKEFGEEFKGVIVEINKEQQSSTNQIYINDLINLKKTVTIAPTFTPKKFIDQIQFVLTGGKYYLYIYLNNTWKSIELI